MVEEKQLAIATLENKKNQELEAAEQAAEKLRNKSENIAKTPEENWKSLMEIPEIASHGNGYISEKMLRKSKNESEEPLV